MARLWFLSAYARMDARSAVSRSPDVVHGALVFAGTRVPVSTLFLYLQRGHSLEEFLRGFPTVSREQALAVLREAGEHVEDLAAPKR